MMTPSYWRSRTWLVHVSVFLVFLTTSSAQEGALTIPLNLSQLSARAEQIVHGRVVASRVEPHPRYRNLNSVVVTVSVSDVFKGPLRQYISFREFIWTPGDIANHGGYRVGDELVLFLNKQSPSGFTSPVGLQQGRMRVMSHPGGDADVILGGGSPRLFQGLDSGAAKLSARARQFIAQPQGRVPLPVLREIVVAVRGESQ